MRSTARFLQVKFAIAATTATLLLWATPAHAGMPTATLSDLARARIEVISFFLALFLASALALKGTWNYLRRDFARLPRLTYKRSLAVVGLWGLLFVLVLTMISGARELMTPGAWVKDGVTYKLNGLSAPDRRVAEQVADARRGRLEELRGTLWLYARQHGGALPADDQAPELPAVAWETPDPSRMRYAYVKGMRIDSPADAVVAYEPPALEGADGALALTADGTIRPMTRSAIRAAIEKHRPPSPATTSPTASSAGGPR